VDLAPRRVRVNGFEVAYLDYGSGPLAVCLHGFPDCARTWRHLLPALAEARFRAVAPWLRGYAPTDLAPDGRYQVGALVADACALHDALDGDGDAVLVGHDWGAMAANGAATFAPDRWRRLVTMATPPPVALARGFFTYEQLRRSWYMFFFLHPMAATVLAMNDLEFVDRLWAEWSPSYAAADDLGAVKDALRGPANLAAALGYYQSTLDSSGRAPELASEEAAVSTPAPQPHLYVHGTDDRCIGAELARLAAEDGALPGEGSRVEFVEGVGHFLHLEAPDQVNRLIVDFLTQK
jgi:pimeloyl-ACP methyl ester carboxylesterase